jgi:hypothetical protein
VRVDRAFAFVDLCGFTAFTDRHGDEQVVLVRKGGHRVSWSA